MASKSSNLDWYEIKEAIQNIRKEALRVNKELTDIKQEISELRLGLRIR